ncbi:MAG: DUF6279 family lipoprotein [Parahaliea sp.]
MKRAYRYTTGQWGQHCGAGRELPGWHGLALLVLLLLTGCSSTAFVYNRLDFLVPWYLDDYVELDREQEQALDALLQPFLAWHRYRELPRYIALLDEGEAMLADGLSLAEIQAVTREMELAGDRIQTRSLDWLLAIGARLSETQVREFIAALDEQQQELEDKYLGRDLEEYREDDYDRFVDLSQDYLGRLDREQRGALRVAIAGLERSDRLWLDERRAWTRRLETLLQRQPGWQEDIRRALAERWYSASAEYRRMYEHNTLVMQQAIVELVNSRSDRQDLRLHEKAARLRNDLATLSRQGLESGANPPGAAVVP